MMNGTKAGNQRKWITLTVVIYAALMCIACTLFLNVQTAYAEENETPDNGIPVVYVTIDESQGTIEEMNQSEHHTAFCKGTVSIDVPEDFRYCDMPTDVDITSLPETSMEIRGRGNSTWNFANKKSYKIRLDKKADIFGLGRNRHWVLLAHAFDKTLLKNRIAAWLGDAIDLEFTPRGYPVDLVIQNTDGTYCKYLGSYYLAENVRIDKNRVEIDELDEDITDPDSIEITGGYLLQNNSQIVETSLNTFNTTRGAGWATKTPDFDDGYENDVQRQYIVNYIQQFEDILYSEDFEGKNGTGYRELMDLESAAKYWLVDQACVNVDGYITGSTYLYKGRDTLSENGTTVPGKLYWGPLWDFDLAWNYDRESDGFTVKHIWLEAMLYDRGEDGFVQEVVRQWPAVKKGLEQIAQDGGIIDRYYEEIKASQERNYEINPPESIADDEEEGFVYLEEIEKLKAWILKRTEWIDQNINDVKNLVHKVNYYDDDGTLLTTEYLDQEKELTSYAPNAEKEGMILAGWVREDGTLAAADDTADSDMNLTAKFVTESEATHAEQLYLRTEEDWVNIIDSNFYCIDYSTVPTDVMDKNVIWTSSDESIAGIDSQGNVTLHKTGDVELTGTLKYYCDVSATLKLHVGDTEIPIAGKIVPDQTAYTLKEGTYGHITVHTEPLRSKVDCYEYISDNTDVVDVDEKGVLYGNEIGTATVTVTALIYLDDGSRTELKTTCKVTVSSEE